MIPNPSPRLWSDFPRRASPWALPAAHRAFPNMVLHAGWGKAAAGPAYQRPLRGRGWQTGQV